ncbi:MAG TPA: plastocyanin/azurin family copper-binding protein [Candidatus Rubrimentiphilum sp.]|nr:plastocyanin/azurin family copper-binding protein [Candidatus Rubrimentiphilum sp.]
MRTKLCLVFLLLTACTNGGTMTPSGGGGSTQIQTIDVNLTLNPSSQTPAGSAGGYSPAVTNVAVGTMVRFVNSDGFAHTATAIPGATTFPAGSPYSSSAQTQSGSAISQNWSSGTLPAGASSQTLLIDKAGTYLFGCFYHYGGPMRAEIVAR